MPDVYETNVPQRLDRLPWARFHWLVVVALGIAWMLDGLEVTIVGSLSGALAESPVLHLTGTEIGLAASAYLLGAVGGALVFGWLTDRLGRKKLFTVTVLVYVVATIACGLSWNFWSFAIFRFLTGAGIGGEYAAVNATIQELIPARRRGFTDLVVNGSFWLGVTLMAAQAFCYNAVFFTYALILTRFYNVASGDVGLFILPFAIGNFLGPLILGRLFDTIGRRIMITVTYGLSGVLMVVTGWMFAMGWLDAVQQTMAWTVIFFVASAAASSAYLTVGESFPLEVRAIAIALFYAFGTGVGGVAGPALFGALIDTGSRMSIFYGYLLGGVLMVIASVVAWYLAVNAERRPLEEVASPLSAV